MWSIRNLIGSPFDSDSDDSDPGNVFRQHAQRCIFDIIGNPRRVTVARNLNQKVYLTSSSSSSSDSDSSSASDSSSDSDNTADSDNDDDIRVRNTLTSSSSSSDSDNSVDSDNDVDVPVRNTKSKAINVSDSDGNDSDVIYREPTPPPLITISDSEDSESERNKRNCLVKKYKQ